MIEDKNKHKIEQSKNITCADSDDTKQNQNVIRKSKRKPLYRRWSFWQSVIIIIITGAYTIFAYRQWKTIENQSTILKRQVESNSEQFAIENRAWVNLFGSGLLELKLGENIIVQIILKNFGNTPALNASIHAGMGISNRLPSSISNLPNLPRNESIDSNIVMAPNIEVSNKLISPEKLTKDMIEQLTQKKAYLYLWGTIYYDDIFEKHHYTEFCSFYKFEKQSFIGCPNHNTMN